MNMAGRPDEEDSMSDERRFEWRAALLAVTAASGALAAAYAVGYARDIPLSALTRDANATGRLPWYAGALSQVGVLVWMAGSAVAVAASTFVAGPDRHFLRWFGLLGMALAFDDALLLHEGPFKPIEHVIYAGYGTSAVWLAVKYFSVMTPTSRALGFTSGAFLAGSVGLDLLDARSAVEDAFKLIGVVSYAALGICQARHSLSTVRSGEVLQ
jgi:hypothetical protein